MVKQKSDQFALSFDPGFIIDALDLRAAVFSVTPILPAISFGARPSLNSSATRHSARDSAGNLYGTTAGGGGPAGLGVVFKVTAAGNETVLHTFTGGADGGSPYAGVVLGPEGNLYGTTTSGGQTNAGVAFKIELE